MIKCIGDNYRICGLKIVKTTKKSLVLDYGLSNATFDTPNHAFVTIFISIVIIVGLMRTWMCFMCVLGSTYGLMRTCKCFMCVFDDYN